jgi:hypothetical protein
MADGNTPDIDFIEVIEPVLDNAMFVIAVGGGIVLGIIAVYAYIEWQKREPTMRAERVEYVEDDEPVALTQLG